MKTIFENVVSMYMFSYVGLFIGQMAREVVAFHVYQPHPTCATDGQVITYPAVEVNNGMFFA